MPRRRPLLSTWRLTVSKLNEMLDLADSPEVGATIRATVRNIVREVFDMHTLLRYQQDKWAIFREKLVEIFPPLRHFIHRIEVLQEYAKRFAADKISRTRKLSRVSRLTSADTDDVDIHHGLETQVLVHGQHNWSLTIRPTSKFNSSHQTLYCEEFPTQGRFSILPWSIT